MTRLPLAPFVLLFGALAPLPTAAGAIVSGERKQWHPVTLTLDGSTHRFLVSSLAFIMALLVAQTRVEAGVHSTLEVVTGGTLGAIVTLVIFQVFSA